MDVHYSSKKHTWETPQDFFNKLNEIFNSNLDNCAETDTANRLKEQWGFESGVEDQDELCGGLG